MLFISHFWVICWSRVRDEYLMEDLWKLIKHFPEEMWVSLCRFWKTQETALHMSSMLSHWRGQVTSWLSKRQFKQIGQAWTLHPRLWVSLVSLLRPFVVQAWCTAGTSNSTHANLNSSSSPQTSSSSSYPASPAVLSRDSAAQAATYSFLRVSSWTRTFAGPWAYTLSPPPPLSWSRSLYL